MSFDLEIGLSQVSTPTSDGNMDFTSSKITKAPKIAMPFITDGAVNGTFDPDISMSIGSTDGNIQGCLSTRGDNGGATANITRRQPNNEVLLRNPNEAAGHHKLTHRTFLSNGWGSNITLTGAFTKLALAMMFGGDDIVRHETLIMASTTGVGTPQTFNFLDTNLKANLLFFSNCGSSQSAGQTSFGTFSFGIAVRQPDGSFKQHNIISRFDVDGSASGNPALIINTDRVSSALLTSDAIQWELELTGINAGSIEVTPRVGVASGDEILVTAMEIKNHNLGLEIFTLPTSTGTYVNTDFGFKPFFVMNIHSMLTAFNSVANGSDAGVVAFSMFNDTEKFCYSINNEDVAATINCDSIVHDRIMHFPFHNGTFGSGAAAINGVDSGTNAPGFTELGYNIDLDIVNTTGVVGFGLGIGRNLNPILRRRHEVNYQGV